MNIEKQQQDKIRFTDLSGGLKTVVVLSWIVSILVIAWILFLLFLAMIGYLLY